MRRFFDALEGTRDACLLGELFCRRPVLTSPAPPPRRALRPDRSLVEAQRAHQVFAGAGIQNPHWDALGGRRLSCRRRPGLSQSASAASRLADRPRSIRLIRGARGPHLRSHRRGLVQEGARGALLATSRLVVEVPADAIALALGFSFARTSLPGSRSCGLRLGLGLRLRLSFRLGLRDDLGVVIVRARIPSSARLAVADGKARGLLLLGVRHHERDVCSPVLVDLGDFSELATRVDLLHERQARMPPKVFRFSLNQTPNPFQGGVET